MIKISRKLLNRIIREQFQIQTDDVDHYREKENQHVDMLDAVVCRCEDIARMMRMHDEDLSDTDIKSLRKIRNKYSDRFEDIIDMLPKMKKCDFETIPHVWREKITDNPHDYPENWSDVVNMYSTGEHDSEILDTVLLKINPGSIATLEDNEENEPMKISESRIRKIVNEELRSALSEGSKPVPNMAASIDSDNVWGDSDPVSIKTGEIKFEWGTYRGRHRDEDYYIDDSSDEAKLHGAEWNWLGDVQFRGDPYSYTKEGLRSPWLKVLSGPKSGRKMIGRTFKLKGRKLAEVWPEDDDSQWIADASPNSQDDSQNRRSSARIPELASLSLTKAEMESVDFMNSRGISANSIQGMVSNISDIAQELSRSQAKAQAKSAGILAAIDSVILDTSPWSVGQLLTAIKIAKASLNAHNRLTTYYKRQGIEGIDEWQGSNLSDIVPIISKIESDAISLSKSM